LAGLKKCRSFLELDIQVSGGFEIYVKSEIGGEVWNAIFSPAGKRLPIFKNQNRVLVGAKEGPTYGMEMGLFAFMGNGTSPIRTFPN